MEILSYPFDDHRDALRAADAGGCIKNESCATGGIHQRRVRTASGSDRILRATQHKYLFRKLLFDPVATARGSDTIRSDSHI